MIHNVLKFSLCDFFHMDPKVLCINTFYFYQNSISNKTPSIHRTPHSILQILGITKGSNRVSEREGES